MRPSVAFAVLVAALATSQVPRAAAESTTQELVDVCVLIGHLLGAQTWDFGLAALDTVMEQRANANLPLPRDKTEL